MRIKKAIEGHTFPECLYRIFSYICTLNVQYGNMCSIQYCTVLSDFQIFGPKKRIQYNQENAFVINYVHFSISFKLN